MRKKPLNCFFFKTFKIYGEQVASKKPLIANERLKVDSTKLKVFILPMTHADPGWLKTFEKYAEDTNQILNNLHSFMTTHPKMRFMWCEISFMEKWWRNVNETVKNDIKKMISTGQLEIASGSWVMTDEANPYFAVSVDNIIEGQQFVLNELNTKPEVIWSNDPFGYGVTEPYLFSKTGIKRAVINRVHFDVKQQLLEKKAIPFLWRQYFDSEGHSDILTHVLPYSHYDVINSCGPNPTICCQFDFKRITHYSCGIKTVPITKDNVVAKALVLEEQFQKMASLFQSNTVFTVWGDDFRYDMIEEWHQQYDNLVLLFDQINSQNRTEIRFGTFADYFKALEEFHKTNKPATLTGDFFPYECSVRDLWTGYYTTRPFFKKLERRLHAAIYAADVATTNAVSLMTSDEKFKVHESLTYARRNLALFQHHDAITGTSRKQVMKDYAQRLHNSIKLAGATLAAALSKTGSSKFSVDNMAQTYDQLPVQTLLQLKPGEKVYARARKCLVALRVTTADVLVKDGEKNVPAQIEPYYDDNFAKYTNDFQLLFTANVGPMTEKLYTVEYKKSPISTVSAEIFVVNSPNGLPQPTKDLSLKSFVVKTVGPEALAISTNRLKTTHNPETGLLNPLNLMRLTRYAIKGPIRQTVAVESEIVQQRISALNIDDADGDLLHIDMRIDIRSLRQVNLVTRFHTSLNPAFMQVFTDSNGLQLLRRQFYSSLSLPANYYPMPTAVVLQDLNRRITIVSDVEHGATGSGDSGIEIMLVFKLLYLSRTTEKPICSLWILQSCDALSVLIVTDRILLHDDGKGLGSIEDGIPNDMLPVKIGFTVIAENMSTNSSLNMKFCIPLSHRSSRASKSSISTSYINIKRLDSVYLHYLASLLKVVKVIAFFVVGFAKEIASENVLDLPCDVQIISIRSISTDVRMKLLVLHRLGTDCGLTTKFSCSMESLTIAVQSYLQKVKVTKVQWTNLSGTLKKNEKIDLNQLSIELKPMEFASLFIYFD
ncbi:unnamed protein product [Enterobius vermicularis]|uniref:Alpha-mannosidase n=1 Tax=Enterobius vermicularis TaxID=51028 RepID=A0A0N4VEE4_ENTVE|nr:unnamed protein product [Enterobius vermicularis]